MDSRSCQDRQPSDPPGSSSSSSNCSSGKSDGERERIRSRMKMVIGQLEGILQELKEVAKELREVGEQRGEDLGWELAPGAPRHPPPPPPRPSLKHGHPAPTSLTSKEMGGNRLYLVKLLLTLMLRLAACPEAWQRFWGGLILLWVSGTWLEAGDIFVAAHCVGALSTVGQLAFGMGQLCRWGGRVVSGDGGELCPCGPCSGT